MYVLYILYILNILCFLYITVKKISYLTVFFRFTFFNPISIPFLISLPVTLFKVFVGPMFILEKGLFDVWFNYALFMTNVSLLVSYIVMVLTLRACKKNDFISNRLINVIKPIRIKQGRALICSLFFFMLFMLFFFLLTQKVGLLNWIKDPRAGYQFNRTGMGHWFALSLFFLSISYTIAALHIRRLNILLITTFIYLLLSYFFGSKGIILSFVVFFMIVLWYRKSKYFKKIIYTVVPLGFGVMLFNFNPSNIMNVVQYFDYYINSAQYFEAYHKGQIDLFYGKIWLTGFYEYLPRAIFPDKPFVYGILHVNEFFFPGAAEASHTPAYGGPIYEFADFGILGVILGAFKLGNIFEIVVLYMFYKETNIEDLRQNSNRLYMFIWFLAPYAMFYFGTIYSVVLLIIVAKTVSIINRLKI